MAEVDAASEAPVLVDRDGHVLTLTLNRARRKNALTPEMLTTMIDAVALAGADDVTRVVVLRANGDDFCSGFELGEPPRSTEGSAGDERGGTRAAKPRAGHLQRSFQLGTNRMIELMESVQVPIVSVVRGWAAGFGNALALSADVVIATPDAKFWVPFVTRGFSPDSGNSWIIPRLVGLARAKEMVMRGKPIDGERAASWGLISQCVAEDELESAASEVIDELANAATVSVGLAKTLLHRNLDVSLSAALQTEGVYEELAIRSDDFKEGMRSFAEKRPPSFTGR